MIKRIGWPKLLGRIAWVIGIDLLSCFLFRLFLYGPLGFKAIFVGSDPDSYQAPLFMAFLIRTHLLACGAALLFFAAWLVWLLAGFLWDAAWSK